MTNQDGYYYIGYFKGMAYPDDIDLEDFDIYSKYQNTLSKKAIIDYIKKLKCCLYPTKDIATDIFNGEVIGTGEVGDYEDGKYIISYELPYYLENYDIGIPPEYEEHLKSKGIK